jgi:hypothetical protein
MMYLKTCKKHKIYLKEILSNFCLIPHRRELPQKIHIYFCFEVYKI